MLEQESREQTSKERTKTRSPLLVWAIVVAAIVVVGLGIWAIVAATQTDDLAAATEKADEFMTAWAGDDPAAVSAVFVEDGVYVSPPPWGYGTFEGREEIEAHARQTVGLISSAENVGDLAEAGDGVYVGRTSFVASTLPFAGDFEVTVEDGLIKRFEWLRVEASS